MSKFSLTFVQTLFLACALVLSACLEDELTRAPAGSAGSLSHPSEEFEGEDNAELGGAGGQQPGAHSARDQNTPNCGPCGNAAECVAHPGGSSCVCMSGYELIDGECHDIDECEIGPTSPCAAEARCDNEPGGYSCTCEGETVGNGFFCKQHAGCEEDSCSDAGVCIETLQGHVCGCDLGHAGQHDCEQSCNTLSFPPALDALVRQNIGKPSGPLIPSDVAHLTRLNARGLELESLDGLECWPWLEELDLTDNRLSASSLTALQNLNQLRILTLDCNPLVNLDHIGEHPRLTHLSVALEGPNCDTPLSDLDALAELPQLTHLDLGQQGLASADVLAQLRALQSLDLGGSALSFEGLVAENHFVALESLDVGNSAVDDWSFLDGFPVLRILNVSGANLSSLNGVEKALRLERLAAAELAEPFDTLTPLASLAQLRELDLSRNGLESVNALSGLTLLRFVSLRGNQMTSVEPLLSLPHLGMALLDDNPVVCSEELGGDEVEQLREQGADVLATCN